MGNANIFRRLKERYDRGNMSSWSSSFPPPLSSSSSSVSLPPASSIISPAHITAIDTPCDDDDWTLTDHMDGANTPLSSPSPSPSSSSSSSNGSISPSMMSPVSRSSGASTPSASPSSSLSLSRYVPSPSSSSSSLASPLSSSSILSPAASTPVKRVSRFSRATAAIKKKINSHRSSSSSSSSSNVVSLPPWIPTTPELILDEKGLHEVFDRFDNDRNGVLCLKEMKLLLLELLEYCIAVEKALLKQAQMRDDGMHVELAHHSLIRLQLIQATPRLVDQWCADLHGACDANKDGRVDRNDFILSFNRHLQLY